MSNVKVKMFDTLKSIKEIIQTVGINSEENVTMPVNVYCSLVRCALQNSTLGFSSSLLNKNNVNNNNNIKSTIDSLLKLSDFEKDGLNNVKMPMPPSVNKGNLEGELKDSLDKVKSELLDHYSLYYNLQEYDIPTRLQLLSQHSNSNNDNVNNNETVNGYKKLLKNNHGVSNGLIEMLDNLKHKFENMNERLNLLENELDNEVSDPNVREWEHSNETKRVMGLNDLDDLENMKDHVHNLYSHLHHQAKINQKKIDVLQKKLQTLTAHTRLVNPKLTNDKRVAL